MPTFILASSTNGQNTPHNKPHNKSQTKTKPITCKHNTTFTRNMNTILDRKLNTILNINAVNPPKKPLQF